MGSWKPRTEAIRKWIGLICKSVCISSGVSKFFFFGGGDI